VLAKQGLYCLSHTRILFFKDFFLKFTFILLLQSTSVAFIPYLALVSRNKTLLTYISKKKNV
jgi:hypothetical protein